MGLIVIKVKIAYAHAMKGCGRVEVVLRVF
jgi:hypothetical protein